MKEIALTKGYVALVDESDFDWLSSFKWSACVSRSVDGKKTYVYAARFGRPKVKMHRQIAGFPDGVLVDHRDGNCLNNQRHNIRTATRSQNMQNSEKKRQRGVTSRFKGVNKDHRGLYVANIQRDGKLEYLGSFKKEFDAAQAYNFAAVEYFGEFARLNT